MEIERKIIGFIAGILLGAICILMYSAIKKLRPKSVWAFMYCCSIHESSYATVSIHATKWGAIKAMYKHRGEAEKQFNIDAAEHAWDWKFGENEDWVIEERNVEI